MTGPSWPEMKTNPPEGTSINSSMTLLQVALSQRDDLGHVIGGASATEAAARDQAKRALATATAAAQPAKITVPANDNVALALTTVSNGLSNQIRQTLSAEAVVSTEVPYSRAIDFSGSR